MKNHHLGEYVRNFFRFSIKQSQIQGYKIIDYPDDPSMEYLPTFTIKNHLNVGKYTSPMYPMGYDTPAFILCWIRSFIKKRMTHGMG